jgi:hypothetical protein
MVRHFSHHVSACPDVARQFFEASPGVRTRLGIFTTGFRTCGIASKKVRTGFRTPGRASKFCRATSARAEAGRNFAEACPRTRFVGDDVRSL